MPYSQRASYRYNLNRLTGKPDFDNVFAISLLLQWFICIHLSYSHLTISIAFSSCRSTPFCYQNSTERWFVTSAYSAITIDLLSSLIQHAFDSNQDFTTHLKRTGNEISVCPTADWHLFDKIFDKTLELSNWSRWFEINSVNLNLHNWLVVYHLQS